MISSRRNLFIAGAVGLAATGMSRQAEARSLTDTERNNLELVTAFMVGQQARPYDTATEFAHYFTPDAKIRLSDDWPALDRAAAVVEVKRFVATSQFRVTIEETFARGPVVVNSRVDSVITPGKPDIVFPIVGVFVVKQGKIVEWTDHLVA